MKRLLPVILFTFVLNACNPSNTVDGPTSNETNSTVQTMPEDMPNDFGFSIQFGVGKNNEIDTFKGTVTKDLIEDGTATAAVTFSDEELAAIYEEMKDVRIIEAKKFIPDPINGTVCVQEPHEEDQWKITINGETITHSFSEEYCEPTNDAKQLLELRNYVFSLIKSKEAYLLLPESTGGYD
ncbi:hypothetical protein MKY34_17565 [Sporosarcina sp. FSL K6-1522]|uniref:hypothetical protein n=1 Tax=Sporosarcina sp. FSL K6-1522 TaxID=2921554 RepID=UPI0031599CBB